MTTVLNLYQRLNNIRSKVAYIKKDKAVENYKAVTHDAVTAETRQWFIEFGVLIMPSIVSESMVDTGARTSKGNVIWRYEARYAIKFVNCDNPAESDTVEVSAHANDHGDKAPGKALSYATKSAILKVLMLETGESDEARVTISAKPGDEIADDYLADMLDEISKAADLPALQKTFGAHYKTAAKDKAAQTSIIAAKDKRKAELASGGAR